MSNTEKADETVPVGPETRRVRPETEQVVPAEGHSAKSVAGEGPAPTAQAMKAARRIGQYNNGLYGSADPILLDSYARIIDSATGLPGLVENLTEIAEIADFPGDLGALELGNRLAEIEHAARAALKGNPT